MNKILYKPLPTLQSFSLSPMIHYVVFFMAITILVIFHISDSVPFQ